MQKYQDVLMVTIGGTTMPLAGASVQVYGAGTVVASTIYSDNGTTTTTNPLTTDANGRFSFYAADGRYDLSITKTGYTTVAVSDVVLEDYLDARASNTIASATALAIPLDQDVVQVSGTTAITSITAASASRGRRVTIVFLASLTFTDGNNLKLAGNFSATADDTISLVCPDGTNFHETSRSVN